MHLLATMSGSVIGWEQEMWAPISLAQKTQLWIQNCIILLYLFTTAYNLLVNNLFTTQCIICHIGYPVIYLGFSLCLVIFTRVTF